MILKSYRVKDFKSVTDSGEIRVDEEITALVGKNESGKTACLEALYRLNPVPTGHPDSFDPLRDFPRPRFAAEQGSVGAIKPIEARFELEQADRDAVADLVGAGVLESEEITVTRSYDNHRMFTFGTNEAKAVPHFLTKHGIDPKLAQGATTLAAAADKLAETGGVAEETVTEIRETKLRRKVVGVLERRMPKFFYFDEYSELPGRISIPHLQRTPDEELTAGQATAQSLLRLAGVDGGTEFTRDLYEERRASLEAASSLISQEVFEFWSQNKNLRVYFDVDWPVDTGDPPTGDQERPVLEIRIENLRHFITLNFSERSAGFQWFFSFLAAFSEFHEKEGIVLLLDEPALGLHATAQADLLRYIEERLAPSHQVLYTTHSPFLIDATKLDRARTVEDRESEGTKVEEDVLATTRETVFPLQAALGYELAQALFIAPDNLAVEGPSDFVYLQTLSTRLATLGRVALDPRWAIVPVGGIDKLPTFIALLGVNLNVAVVLDGAAGGSQKINAMTERGLINSNAVVPLATITGGKEADIEDMFDESWYLKLVKDSGVGQITKAKLSPGNRIVPRIESAIGKYDHFQPARFLLSNPERVESLDDATLDRFEALFKKLNELLS
ncbi:MAG TPA: AAA family ATPase [Solirubrobacterales bacterium]|nr:AAA family ATPase [Solirubrobacterales bacterium]